MQIAIPSYRRADKIFELTIASLIRSGANLADVTVFLSDPDEHEAYVKATGGMVKIVDSVPTKSKNVSFILNYYPKDTEILFVDDDIKAFEKLSKDGKKLVETDLSFAKKGFELCRKHGTSTWGIYAARNAFFMKPRITRGLFLQVGSCWGLINTGSEAHHVPTDEKDDYRRGFQVFKEEGKLIRFDYITVNTAYYKQPGGMQERRTPKIIERAAKILAEDYPEYCTVYKSKGKGTWELKLNNREYKTEVLHTVDMATGNTIS